MQGARHGEKLITSNSNITFELGIYQFNQILAFVTRSAFDRCPHERAEGCYVGLYCWCRELVSLPLPFNTENM